MTVAPVSELKASLSSYLRRVQAGEAVLITDRGRPIAQLSPVLPHELDDERHLAALEREGKIRRPTRPVPDWLWTERPAAPDAEGSVRAALLEERDER